MSEIRYYFDEHINPVIAEQLQRHNIDVVLARDFDALGDPDINHLNRAIGGWVRALRDLHAKETAESMINQVKFLNVK